MTKKELYTTVVGAIAALNLGEAITGKVNGVLDTYLAPKAGGASVNLDDVTKKDAAGKVTHILCAKSGEWLPANALNFYKQNNGKGIIGTDGASLHRTSLAGNKAFTEHNKAVKATKEAILEDLASGKLSPEEITGLQAKLKAANESKPDYSKVEAVVAKPAEAKAGTQTAAK